MMQKTLISLSQCMLLTTFSISLSAETINKPPLVQNAAQAMKNISTVLKYNPGTTDKIDAFLYDSIDTLDKTVEKIENDIPKEKRKAAEKAITDEFKEAEQTFKKLLKKHAESVDQKITEIIGEKEVKQAAETINDASKELDANARATFNDPAVKELGKAIDKASTPIKQALENIDGTNNPVD